VDHELALAAKDENRRIRSVRPESSFPASGNPGLFPRQLDTRFRGYDGPHALLDMMEPEYFQRSTRRSRRKGKRKQFFFPNFVPFVRFVAQFSAPQVCQSRKDFQA
jgi:hypothetical protein